MPSVHTPWQFRLIRSRWLLLFNLIVLSFLGLSFAREYVRANQLKGDVARLQTQAEQLQKKKVDLMELKASLQTQSSLEREARLKLGLKKPGEKVVVVHEATGVAMPEYLKDGDPLPEVFKDVTPKPYRSNPQKWWDVFFGE
ncbi:septum formation initiator family protein [Candidatus Uhrbacteria bacterium]|nr:septum formation initiator family protein [Candidatus Uhrbacteria bacterium]